MKSCKSHENIETKNIRPLVFNFSPTYFVFWCFLLCFFMWFARFQILISEPKSIWRKLLVLSWLYQPPCTAKPAGLFLHHSVSLLTLIWRLTQLKNLLQHLGLIRLLCVYLKDYCSVGAQCYMPYCALAKFSLACIKESAWVLKLNEQNRNGFDKIFFN